MRASGPERGRPAAWVGEARSAGPMRRGRATATCGGSCRATSGLAEPALAALGFRGQAVAVIPSKRLVVAQTADRHDSLVELNASHFFQLVRLIAAAHPGE